MTPFKCTIFYLLIYVLFRIPFKTFFMDNHLGGKAYVFEIFEFEVGIIIYISTIFPLKAMGNFAQGCQSGTLSFFTNLKLETERKHCIKSKTTFSRSATNTRGNSLNMFLRREVQVCQPLQLIVSHMKCVTKT